MLAALPVGRYNKQVTAFLAQLVEQGFCKAQAVGSSPSEGLTPK